MEHLSEEEVKTIVKGVVNGDTKRIGPMLMFTMVVAVGGWIYQIGISNAQQSQTEKVANANTEKIDRTNATLAPISESVKVIETDVQYLKRDIQDIKTQMRIDKAEILDAIKTRHNGVTQ